MVLQIIYHDKEEDKILVYDSVQFQVLNNEKDKTNYKKKVNNYTKHFHVLFTSFDMKYKLTIEKSIYHHIKECLHQVLNDNKKIYLRYYLQNDLALLSRLCKLPIEKQMKQLEDSIKSFEDKYPNECGKLLANFKPNEIDEIIKQDANLATKEKIYIWLCTNDRFKK